MIFLSCYSRVFFNCLRLKWHLMGCFRNSLQGVKMKPFIFRGFLLKICWAKIRMTATCFPLCCCYKYCVTSRSCKFPCTHNYKLLCAMSREAMAGPLVLRPEMCQRHRRGSCSLELGGFLIFLSELFQLALIPKQYSSFKTIFIHSHQSTVERILPSPPATVRLSLNISIRVKSL